MKREFNVLKAAGIILISAFMASCEKNVAEMNVAAANSAVTNEKLYQYPIYSMSGAETGIFTITSSEKGGAVVTIQLNQATGTLLTASINNPQRNGADPLYIKLNDVNTEGYSRTENVADGTRVLSAEQLANLIGFEVQLRKGNDLFARGAIR